MDGRQFIKGITDPKLKNHDVALYLATMEAASLFLRGMKSNSLANVLQVLTLFAGAAFVINQKGAMESYNTAVGFFSSMMGGSNSRNAATSRRPTTHTREELDEATIGDLPKPGSPSPANK